MKRFFIGCMFVGVFFLGATYGLNKAMTIVEQTLALETAPVTSPSQPLKFGGTTGAFPTVYLPDCETGGTKGFRIYSDDEKFSGEHMTLDWSENVAVLSTTSTHDAIRIAVSAPMVSLSMTQAIQEDHRECKRCGHALNVLPKDDPRLDREGNRIRRHQAEGLMSMEIRVTNEEGREVFSGCLWCLAKILDNANKKETK